MPFFWFPSWAWEPLGGQALLGEPASEITIPLISRGVQAELGRIISVPKQSLGTRLEGGETPATLLHRPPTTGHCYFPLRPLTIAGATPGARLVQAPRI